MKKLILCSLITINVAFSMDCNAMINRYANKPIMFVKSCIHNNNADACLCFAATIYVAALESHQSGDYKKAGEYEETAIILVKKACQLGNKEICAILDKSGMER